MSVFWGGDREGNFIENFYKRDLSERDLRSFNKDKMRISKISKIFRSSAEQQELRALYREAEKYRDRLEVSQDKDAIEQCNKNMQKLAALAWPGIGRASLFAVGSEDSARSEEEILAEGGFSEEEVQEIAAVLKSLPRTETVSVTDPNHLTPAELEKVRQKEKKGINVFISPALRIVQKNRENQSYGVINQQIKRELLEGPVKQLAKDFERDVRVYVLTNRGLNRFDPKDEWERDLSPREADMAALQAMHCIENLQGLTVGERVFVLANSEQNIYGEQAHAFRFAILPEIRAILNSKSPEGHFVATFREKSELVHDVRKKQTTFSQIVSVGDLNLQGEEKGATPPLVLQFRVSATLDWKTEEMTLDRVQLISADATPLRE